MVVDQANSKMVLLIGCPGKEKTIGLRLEFIDIKGRRLTGSGLCSHDEKL